jgi:PhoPQ-activated pathogenicity-related protein
MKKILINFFILSCFFTIAFASKPVTPQTALHNSDKTFKWEVQDKKKGEGVMLYRILFTSQQWRGINWNHEMFIIVPDILKYNDALLFITGGSLKDGKPNMHEWNEDLTTSLIKVAKTNMTIVALLWQVPNQPLYDNLTEDALISYTLHNYLKDHDFTWPLLFPMTKSAIRAMDIVQKFSKKEVRRKIGHFIVSGASKRGWTTWLTGANDNRVKAIAPMVIDVLNMPVNVDYQKKVWGDYSVEINDYVKLGIAQQFGTPGGDDLVKMVDPYSYRKTLTMPKMIYWPADAVKNYIDSIPGDNHICYTPNAAHGLGDKKMAFATLSAFLGTTVTNSKYTKCEYQLVEKDGKINLTVETTPGLLVEANLWSAYSIEDQDFRNEKWSPTLLKGSDNPEIQITIDYPQSGYKAFYIDLKYKALSGDDYTQSTRMFVTTDKKVLLRQ